MNITEPAKTVQRNHAIDFVKGICILLVIIDHARLVDPNSHVLYQMLDQIEVAGFFFISGYLYRDTGILKEWLDGKLRRLLIPFLFFGLLYALADGLCNPARFTSEWKVYLIHLYLSPVNYPLWFIRALFWMMLLQRSLRHFPIWVSGIIAGSIICIMSLFGNLIQTESPHTFIRLLFRLNIICAIASYPFFLFGKLARNYKVLQDGLQHGIRWGTLGCSLILWIVFARPDIHLHVPSAGSWSSLYISALAGCMTILLLSKNIPRIPFVNYLGQHSLTVLGTHAIFINVFQTIGLQSAGIIALCTIVAMFPTIFTLQQFLPEAIGEKKQTKHH